MADNWVCSTVSASLCCSSTTDNTHSMNLDSLENALLAMLPVEVVPPEGSGWSTFNPVFSTQGFVHIYHGLADISRSWLPF